jgi:hypothetical protein
MNSLFAGSSSSESDQFRNPEYVLKSVVCFLGAHYMTYIKKTNISGRKVWKLYDDQRSIKEYSTWGAVLDKILEAGTLPTVLMYERITKENENDDAHDRVGSTELL